MPTRHLAQWLTCWGLFVVTTCFPRSLLWAPLSVHMVYRWELREAPRTVTVHKRHLGAPCASGTWQDVQKGLTVLAVLVTNFDQTGGLAFKPLIGRWCLAVFCAGLEAEQCSLRSQCPFGSLLRPRAFSLEKYLNTQDYKGNQLFWNLVIEII